MVETIQHGKKDLITFLKVFKREGINQQENVTMEKFNGDTKDE